MTVPTPTPADSRSSRPLPIGLQWAGSMIAVGHLLAIGLYALAAPSGPWVMPPPIGGESPAEGPQFAKSISMTVIRPHYLEWLRMTHNYHFASNRPVEFAVWFEVRLKTTSGDVRTLKFPEEKANYWVRHRHEVLAQNLVPDQRLQGRGNQRLAAPGQELPKVEIWVRDGDMTLRLKEVDENDELVRNPQTDQPSAWSRALVKSYLRYLCREYNAESAELIRHSRPTVMPSDLFVPRPDIFKELTSHFGEQRRD